MRPGLGGKARSALPKGFLIRSTADHGAVSPTRKRSSVKQKPRTTPVGSAQTNPLQPPGSVLGAPSPTSRRLLQVTVSCLRADAGLLPAQPQDGRAQAAGRERPARSSFCPPRHADASTGCRPTPCAAPTKPQGRCRRLIVDVDRAGAWARLRTQPGKTMRFAVVQLQGEGSRPCKWLFNGPRPRLLIPCSTATGRALPGPLSSPPPEAGSRISQGREIYGARVERTS